MSAQSKSSAGAARNPKQKPIAAVNVAQVPFPMASPAPMPSAAVNVAQAPFAVAYPAQMLSLVASPTQMPLVYESWFRDPTSGCWFKAG